MKYKPVPPPAPRKLPPPDAAERIRALAADGWSVRGIAAQFGTSQDLLRRWYERHPELKDAMDQGRDSCEHVLHNKLYRLATEGAGKESMVAAMFLLKCKFGWREGDQQEPGNRVSVTFNIPAAMPLDKFMTVENEQSDNRAERLPNPPARATRRG